MAATPTPDLGFQNFFSALLTGDITSSSTDIPMDSIPNASQGFLVIEPDSASNREVIFYDSKTALKVVCPSAADGRGQDDTTAVAHSTGAQVIMAPVAAFYEALQNGRALNNVFGGAMLGATHYYTYDGTDIFVDGVDQNNAANTINWAKPTGLKYAIVEVVGGGGGGGGSGTTTTSGGGGGGGGYSRKKILAGSLGSTETVTVGAKGAGGASGNNAGANGGDSSFGAHCTGGGGTGGQPGNGSFNQETGGVATGGDLNIRGGHGAGRVSGTCTGTGQGGDSMYGTGAPIRPQAGLLGSNCSAAGYGGGGAGGARTSSNVDGGDGTAGIVIVYEFY